MTKKHQNGTIILSFSQNFPELFMAMSTKKTGNLNIGKVKIDNAGRLLQRYGIGINQFVAMEQIHSNKIRLVNRSHGGSIIPGVDGLLTTDKNLYLGVKTADCVPIYLYSPKPKIIGIVHAGWKSTLEKITAEAVQAMVDLGACTKEIYILFGPYIHKCCYHIDKKRADLFNRIFKSEGICQEISGSYYLDLGYANKYALMKEGIPGSHIEAEADCTSCKNQEYFSYRKDSGTTYGAMLSIIGLKNN